MTCRMSSFRNFMSYLQLEIR